MLMGHKILEKEHESTLSYLFFTIRELDLENISLGFTLNLSGVS